MMGTTICPFVIYMIVLGSCINLTISEMNCPEYAYHNGDLCFEPHLDQPSTFEHANNICSDSKGTLAVIRDYITQQFLKRLALKKMHDNFWIGNGNISSKDCIAIKSQDAYAQRKEDRHQNFFYICEKDVCSSSSLTIGEFNNKCYEMMMERSKCLVASQSCEKRGGRLAVFDTDGKLEFIQKFLYTNEWWTTVTNEIIDHLNLSDEKIFWAGAKFEQRSKKWITAGGTQEDLFYDYHIFNNSDLRSVSDSCVTSEFKPSDCDSHKYFFCQYSQSLQTSSALKTFVGIVTIIATLVISIV